MIVVLKVNKHFLLLINVRLGIHGLYLRQMLCGERVLGNVLNAHFELEECANFASIEQEFYDRVTSFERFEQKLERAG